MLPETVLPALHVHLIAFGIHQCRGYEPHSDVSPSLSSSPSLVKLVAILRCRGVQSLIMSLSALVIEAAGLHYLIASSEPVLFKAAVGVIAAQAALARCVFPSAAIL